MSNMLLIHLHGGTSGAVHTHNYHEWHLTIYPYQVRSIGTSPPFIDFLQLHPLMLNGYSAVAISSFLMFGLDSQHNLPAC